MASSRTTSEYTLHTSAGLDATFGSLNPSSSSTIRNAELLEGLCGTGGPSFAMPEVDDIDTFERNVVEYVKPNHGT